MSSRSPRVLIPELSARAIQTDKDRKVPAENIKLLADSGLLGIFRARKWGGQELSMRAHVDAISTIAEGCQATAWVLGVYHAHDYIFGHMSEKAQEDIYGTGPNQAVAAVIGPRGKAIRKSRRQLCAEWLLAFCIRQCCVGLAVAWCRSI